MLIQIRMQKYSAAKCYVVSVKDYIHFFFISELIFKKVSI